MNSTFLITYRMPSWAASRWGNAVVLERNAERAREALIAHWGVDYTGIEITSVKECIRTITLVY